MDNIFSANQKNIVNFRQNHPELVVQDCRNYGFSDEQLSVVRQSMLVRGVNKWLKVRRDLIAYKKKKKHEVKIFNARIPILRVEMNSLYCTHKQVIAGLKSISDLEAYYSKRIEYESAREKLKVLTETRGTLKRLCNTDRWQIWVGKRIEDMNTLRASD